MFGWFNPPLKPQLGPDTTPERGSDADKVMVRSALEKGECPDCGSKNFYEGPSGGVCVNFKCAECGSKFNVGGFAGTLMIADRIG